MGEEHGGPVDRLEEWVPTTGEAEVAAAAAVVAEVAAAAVADRYTQGVEQVDVALCPL